MSRHDEPEHVNGQYSLSGEFGRGKSNAALMIAEKLREAADRMHEVGMDMVEHREAPFYEHGMEICNAAATAYSWAQKIEEEQCREHIKRQS